MTVVRPNGFPVQPVQIPPARTDGNGRFSFRNLEPGTYFLRASAEGYAQQEYNVRPGAASGVSTQVTLSAGQAVKNIQYRWRRSGRLSSDGQFGVRLQSNEPVREGDPIRLNGRAE